MESIKVVKPRNYSEALQVLENVIYAARFVVRQGWTADVAAKMLDTALEQGLYTDTDSEQSLHQLGDLMKQQFLA